MLSSLAPNFNVCFAVENRIERDSESSNDLDAAIKAVLAQSSIRVVVVFAEKISALRLLEAARQDKDARKLIWISSDAWKQGNEPERTANK
jgi:hypothetical protein